MKKEPLFYREGDLRNFLEAINRSINREIDALEKKLLREDEEKLIEYLKSKYELEAPTLNEGKKYLINESEIDIDVSQDRHRAIFDRTRPSYVKGISITIAVPFEGDPNLFYYTPRPYDHGPPYGDVEDQEIHLTYQQIDHNADELERDISQEINKINKYLNWVRNNIKQFNDSLMPFIRDVIRQRRAKLQKDVDLIEKLGIPFKKRNDIPKTYTIPKIRKKTKIERPKDTEKPFKPEPILDAKDYEDILNTIQSMALAIERNPRAFAEMGEEDLRWVILIPLNAIYEGQATGETFNYEGKTDILIRVENKNVFIAECKIWSGEKGLIDTIDQLLGYTSWRDTKTAILLFFKGKKFSTMLEKIPEAMKSHSCYISGLDKKDETVFRYKFHHRDDTQREIILSVMAFSIPSLETS